MEEARGARLGQAPPAPAPRRPPEVRAAARMTQRPPVERAVKPTTVGPRAEPTIAIAARFVAMVRVAFAGCRRRLVVPVEADIGFLCLAREEAIVSEDRAMSDVAIFSRNHCIDCGTSSPATETNYTLIGPQ